MMIDWYMKKLRVSPNTIGYATFIGIVALFGLILFAVMYYVYQNHLIIVAGIIVLIILGGSVRSGNNIDARINLRKMGLYETAKFRN